MKIYFCVIKIEMLRRVIRGLTTGEIRINSKIIILESIRNTDLLTFTKHIDSLSVTEWSKKELYQTWKTRHRKLIKNVRNAYDPVLVLNHQIFIFSDIERDSINAKLRDSRQIKRIMIEKYLSKS
jgi:hypothetical protein